MFFCYILQLKHQNLLILFHSAVGLPYLVISLTFCSENTKTNGSCYILPLQSKNLLFLVHSADKVPKRIVSVTFCS